MQKLKFWGPNFGYYAEGFAQLMVAIVILVLLVATLAGY